MTKRELIDEILVRNRTAQPDFLAHFEDADLQQYLRHLDVLRTPRLTGDSSRYEKYFANHAPTWALQRPSQTAESAPRTDPASQAA